MAHQTIAYGCYLPILTGLGDVQLHRTWISTLKGKSGEGGIRTPGTRLGYIRFPSVHLRPLGHLSKKNITVTPGYPVSHKKAGNMPKRIRTSDPQFRKLMLYPSELWARVRRGRDLNPRYGYPYNTLAGCHLRPLGHLSWLCPLPTGIPVFNELTERVGFEPTVGLPTLVFKTRSFDRSDTSPKPYVKIS